MNQNPNIGRMIDILKRHGIEMYVGGCGCCNSPWVTFIYKGETILDDEENASFQTGPVTDQTAPGHPPT